MSAARYITLETRSGVAQNRTMSKHHASARTPVFAFRRGALIRGKAMVTLLLFLLPLLLFAESAPFRFVWLSDTHVGSTTGEQDLRAAVRDINSLTGMSFVVHSGDVTEYGSREQLRLAKEILDGIKIPTHILPGNHDTKWSESGATDFPAHLEAGPVRFRAWRLLLHCDA